MTSVKLQMIMYILNYLDRNNIVSLTIFQNLEYR
jgi:hypothetical protein